MKKPISKPLRFVVDRKSGCPFVGQLVEAIRRAIASGYYRDGDVLPPLEDLAGSAGVSIIVPREAIARLSDEGLVVPRRGVGSIVNAPKRNSRLGHVVIVTSEISDNFTIASICGVLRQELIRSGYMVSHVSVVVGQGNRPDFSQLDAVLSGAVSLVLVLANRWKIARHVQRTGIPMVGLCEDYDEGGNVIGRFRCADLPIDDFVAHCVRAHLEDVVEVTFDDKRPMTVVALQEKGMRVRNLHFPASEEADPCYSSVERRMFDAVVKLCKSGKRLPDLLFFDDDVAARGALTAFLSMGVRVPDEVRIAAITAFGRQPVFGVPLTRIEINPQEIGRVWATYALELLKGDRPTCCPRHSAKYIIGGTFPDGVA